MGAFMSVITIIDVVMFTLFDGITVEFGDRAICRAWYF